MRNSIPSYSQRIAPLHDLLESCYKEVGKRSKQALRKLSITTSWGASHDAAFADIKKQLIASVKLALPKLDQNLCLFTDASDTYWASILTQVPPCGIYACIPIALTRLLSQKSSKHRITCQVRGCAQYSALERTYALGHTLN